MAELDPDAVAELRLLRAEITALREHVTAPPPGAPWTRKTWLPEIHEGHLELPERHYQLLRGLRPGRELWRHHPHVRTGGQLTFGERAADVMRNAFGSWAFVGSFLVFIAFWVILNSLLLRSGFDRYPYILLNLGLSMMAGLQGALILIAAKRADRVSAEQALAHYTETGKLDELQQVNNVMTGRVEAATTKLDQLQHVNNEMTGRIEEATKLLTEIHRHVTAMPPLAGTFTPEEEETHG